MGKREEGEDKIDLTSDSLGGNRKKQSKIRLEPNTARWYWGGEVVTGFS